MGCDGKTLRVWCLQGAHQSLELGTAVRAALQVGTDQRHPGGGAVAAPNGFGELVEQPVNVIAGEFHFLSRRNLAAQDGK